jgi:hypothetical protein
MPPPRRDAPSPHGPDPAAAAAADPAAVAAADPAAVAAADAAESPSRKRHRDDPEDNVARAVTEGVWPCVAATTVQFFRERATQQMLRARLRRRIDVQTDPLRLENAAGGGTLATWGVDARCDGDRRFLKVMETLDMLHQERTELQKMWHYHMLCACLPHIYRKDWPGACRRVLKSLGVKEMKAEVMIMTPRRFGKTTAVAMLVAALLLSVPGIKISVISTGQRASGKLKVRARVGVCGVHQCLYRPDGVCNARVCVLLRRRRRWSGRGAGLH